MQNFIITCILLINATLPKLREFLEQETYFGHKYLIPDEPAQVVVMIMKYDQENKQGTKNDKSSRIKEISGSQNAPDDPTTTMVIEEEISSTMTLVVKDDNLEDEQAKSDE